MAPPASAAPSTKRSSSSLLGVFAFNYVFTQTMLATNPDLQTIK